jgi:hypothetical protein
MARVAGGCFWMFFLEGGRVPVDDALLAPFLVSGGVPEGQRRRSGRICGLFVTASGKGTAAGRQEAPDVEANEHLACELPVEANELLLVVPCKVEACEEAEANEHDAWNTEACEGEEANEPEACNVEACCEGEVHDIIEVSPEPIERTEDL